MSKKQKPKPPPRRLAKPLKSALKPPPPVKQKPKPKPPPPKPQPKPKPKEKPCEAEPEPEPEKGPEVQQQSPEKPSYPTFNLTLPAPPKPETGEGNYFFHVKGNPAA